MGNTKSLLNPLGLPTIFDIFGSSNGSKSNNINYTPVKYIEPDFTDKDLASNLKVNNTSNGLDNTETLLYVAGGIILLIVILR